MPTLTTAMTNASPATCAKPAPKSICTTTAAHSSAYMPHSPAVLDAIHLLRFALVQHSFLF